MDLILAGAMPDDPAGDLALDEALLRAGPPRALVRVWRTGRCVVLGRGQRPEREVDLAACDRDGIPVLRRSSGGGTVYLDPGCLVVTLVEPGRQPELIARLADLVAGVLLRLGFRALPSRRGVFIGPTKVSGLASQVAVGATLAHATLLVSTPPTAVGEYLTPAPAEPHPLDSHRSPVVALAGLDPAVTVPAARQAVLAEVAHRAGGLRPRPLTGGERQRWRELTAHRYRRPAWHATGREG